MTTVEFRTSLQEVRRVSIPLLGIRTADPASAMAHMIASLDGAEEEIPILTYDVLGGLQGKNELGRDHAAVLLGPDAMPNIDPGGALQLAQKLQKDGILFFLNANRIWDLVDVVQGIWNLRDRFKLGGQTLVLLTTPGAMLPAELRSDVMLLDEPLPTIEDLAKVALTNYESIGLPPPKKPEMAKITDALIGLADFPAENALALALTKKQGCNIELLWERKCQAIQQTRGLSVHRGKETFADIGGCEEIKEFMRAVIQGQGNPRGLVFADEIEKAMAGAGTSLDGTKTDMQGYLLTWMQDHNADGVLFLGPPGTAKTAMGKAIAAEAGIPMISCDFAGMQSGIVGSSGENLRNALSVIEAVTQGRSLWIGTCNSLTNLPPELRRRFKLSTPWFFDLPNRDDRRKIWAQYCTQYDIDPRKVAGKLPNDEGWTGADIKECCQKAWRFKIPLTTSAKYIVPLIISDATKIERLRSEASGKFLDASSPGIYRYQTQEPISGKRRFAAEN
jgi:hypothetical protein